MFSIFDMVLSPFCGLEKPKGVDLLFCELKNGETGDFLPIAQKNMILYITKKATAMEGVCTHKTTQAITVEMPREFVHIVTKNNESEGFKSNRINGNREVVKKRILPVKATKRDSLFPLFLRSSHLTRLDMQDGLHIQVRHIGNPLLADFLLFFCVAGCGESVDVFCVWCCLLTK